MGELMTKRKGLPFIIPMFNITGITVSVYDRSWALAAFCFCSLLCLIADEVIRAIQRESE